ncbi:MAG TPA: potassium-transporting ATPase subunit KdpA [Solirubrobacteraceae bacterium]|jgi:K+-transporting ATPase ATPase A chain|nr:potassium-transporting ATPase subunit KdpA [Solirubrobacteraceae bacterium]
MTAAGWIEIALYIAVLTAITPLLGAYMTRVYRGELTIGIVERSIDLLDGRRAQDWKAYAKSVLISSAVFFGVLYLILRTQGIHPWNPKDLDSAPWDVAFNTTASFVTNTNWQFYAGETTMSNFSQMTGLAVQNFASAAVGIAVAVAFIRALAARSGRNIGNFYGDLVKTLVYVLLPISVVVGLFLVSQGVIQSLTSGPVASQEVIKELGTNGGGFFNVNSAHPFENPTWLSNFVELVLILAIPAALTSVYGRMVGNRRQGWAIYSAMLSLLIVAVVVVAIAENGSTPAMDAAGVTGMNMEGKEQRFGVASTALWVVVTTAASCGAVNGAMESLSGIGGLVPMANMQTGEVVFGGVGSGLYGMLMFAILGVFLSGLMVGRTPEFLGKKIEAREIKLTVFGTIGVPMLVLVTSALAIASDDGRESIYNSGPQGWSETLYAYTSQGNNNGSAFAGYTGFVQPADAEQFGITFANVLGGLAMIGGRFLPLLAVLAIAGSLAGKRVAPAGAGTFRTDSPTFVVVLIAIVLIVALLTFVPALLLGPVVQGMTDQLF